MTTKKPTPEQMEHFYRLQAERRVTSTNFQKYLQNPDGWEQKSTSLILTLRPFDFSKYLPGWAFWRGSKEGDGLEGKERHDPRALAMTTLDVSKIVFSTMFVGQEMSITGDVAIDRQRVDTAYLSLDARSWQALWEARHQLPEEWKDGRMFFCDGSELRNSDGNRCTLDFYFRGGEWGWDYRWVGSDRSSGCVSARLPAK